MQKVLTTVAFGAAAMFAASGAFAQSGTVAKAVGGYSFEDAAKEAPGTKNFHTAVGGMKVLGSRRFLCRVLEAVTTDRLGHGPGLRERARGREHCRRTECDGCKYFLHAIPPVPLRVPPSWHRRWNTRG